MSAGSSASRTAWIGRSFVAGSGGRSWSSTTKAVVRFGPIGTSTREPRRTASRSRSGIAYVNVPCTARGRATSAYGARPVKGCRTFKDVAGVDEVWLVFDFRFEPLPAFPECRDEHRQRGQAVS